MASDNNGLFRRLTKLFRSGPVVKRRVRDFESSSKSTSALPPQTRIPNLKVLLHVKLSVASCDPRGASDSASQLFGAWLQSVRWRCFDSTQATNLHLS